jgi:hypothetical protein
MTELYTSEEIQSFVQNIPTSVIFYHAPWLVKSDECLTIFNTSLEDSGNKEIKVGYLYFNRTSMTVNKIAILNSRNSYDFPLVEFYIDGIKSCEYTDPDYDTLLSKFTV